MKLVSSCITNPHEWNRLLDESRAWRGSEILVAQEWVSRGRLMGLLRDLTRRWAIVEWVPASDPMFVELVRGREEIYGHLNEAAFTAAIDRYFLTTQKERLRNGRTLYLLELR